MCAHLLLTHEMRGLMAIGSTPEIGMVFSRWGEMSEDSRAAWFSHMVRVFDTHLMGGYAKVIYVDRTGTTDDES